MKQVDYHSAKIRQYVDDVNRAVEDARSDGFCVSFQFPRPEGGGAPRLELTDVSEVSQLPGKILAAVKEIINSDRQTIVVLGDTLPYIMRIVDLLVQFGPRGVKLNSTNLEVLFPDGKRVILLVDQPGTWVSERMRGMQADLYRL